ncbi:hypothetical protein [Bacteroides acidifaciens]|uniref:hypothetical protein n=1 Tax=Bacteroides acidifaciens TaxID=85831 RepID=UPI00263A7FD9|nr:hypothetical protein [Bacteroides acidifaciens]
MNTHFSFIGINGNAGETFSSVLKDKCNNDIRFISFINVSDSPFSFPIGYAISLQTNFIDSTNIFELIGISAQSGKSIIEERRLDLR